MTDGFARTNGRAHNLYYDGKPFGVLMSSRTAKMERKTRETDVSISLDIDGTGKYDVDCDNQFLRHMIETFSRYSSGHPD